MRYGGSETAGHDMPRLILRRKRAVKGSGLFVLDHDLSHSLWCIRCIVIFIWGARKLLYSLSLSLILPEGTCNTRRRTLKHIRVLFYFALLLRFGDLLASIEKR